MAPPPSNGSSDAYLLAQLKGSAAISLRNSKLPQPPIDTSYPSTTSFDPGIICPWDLICVNRVAIPISGSPEGGTKLDVDKQKPQGQDYAHVIGKGYEGEPVKFTLLLFFDVLSGTNWLAKYEQQVREILMPQKKLSKRNAVEVYHPAYAGDGIHSVVIERRGVPKHIGKQMWTVDVEGIDLRTTKIGSATKKMRTQDTKLIAKATALQQAGATPADAQAGRP